MTEKLLLGISTILLIFLIYGLEGRAAPEIIDWIIFKYDCILYYFTRLQRSHSFYAVGLLVGLPADMSKLQSKARDRSLGLILNITALRHTVLSKLFHLPKPRRNGQIRF